MLAIDVFPLPAVDVRLGDQADVGGQQPRGASHGMGRRVGAGLAVPQRLHARHVPGMAMSEKFLREYNRRIVLERRVLLLSSPADFRLERREVQVFSTREVPDPKLEAKVRGTHAEFLRFTSPVHSPYPENNLVNARWFPARGRRAVVLLPHWNSDALAYTGLCRVLNLMGISVLRLSMPYHDIRMPADTHRADYAVSANIGRTLDACRQAVIDVRCCLDWLEQQGYNRLGILGTSLGSCYAFLATAHDSRNQSCRFQPRRDLCCRRGLARAIDPPHSSGARSANRSGTAALALERHQSDFLLRAVCPLAQESRSLFMPSTT